MAKWNGFTLVELMVTIAIAAILLTVAVPSFITTIQNNRMTASLNDFVTDLNLARSEAVKLGSRVTVCKSADGVACTTEGDWSQGWIVFSDPNNTGLYETGVADETLLRVHQALPDANTTLVGNSNVNNYISFTGTGFTQLIIGGFQAGTLIMCDDRGFGRDAKAIVINTVGRINTLPANDSSLNVDNCNASS